MAAATIAGHSTGSASYGCCTIETGHSMCGAGDPTMNDLSDTERTSAADPLTPYAASISQSRSGYPTSEATAIGLHFYSQVCANFSVCKYSIKLVSAWIKNSARIGFFRFREENAATTRRRVCVRSASGRRRMR